MRVNNMCRPWAVRLLNIGSSVTDPSDVSAIRDDDPLPGPSAPASAISPYVPFDPAPAGAIQLARGRQLQVQYVIGGHCRGIATASRRHLSAVENLVDQHLIGSPVPQFAMQRLSLSPISGPAAHNVPRLASASAARGGYPRSSSRWFDRGSNLVLLPVAV